MADIKNKNELKRRIELFLDELDYSINEDFCKETMKMMREFIGHASNRLDCENSRAKSLKKKLKEYEGLEEQGLLLRLPCAVGDTVYKPNPITLSEIVEIKIESIFITESEINISGRTTKMKYSFCCRLSDFGKTVFLTKAEAEQKLKEMDGDY